MINRLMSAGAAPRTVGMARDVLRAALNVAIRWELLDRNVAQLVNVPTSRPEARRALSPSEARTFVESIGSDRLAALYLLAIATGMRQGALLGLSWAELDVDGGEIRVVATLSHASSAAQLKAPKTKGSRRRIPIPPSVLPALRAHRIRQLEERLLAGSRWSESGLVFTTSIGTPLDGPTVTRRLHRLLGAAGLPQITFHDLRHSCASLTHAHGVPARVVMEILGHSDIRLTMNLYTHVGPELQRDAANRIDTLFIRTGERHNEPVATSVATTPPPQDQPGRR